MTNRERVKEIIDNIESLTNDLDNYDTTISKIIADACGAARENLEYVKEDDEDELDNATMMIPVSLLFSKDLWDEYCNITGTNEWAVNEGLLSKNDTVEITISKAKKIGLI